MLPSTGPRTRCPPRMRGARAYCRTHLAGPQRVAETFYDVIGAVFTREERRAWHDAAESAFTGPMMLEPLDDQSWIVINRQQTA